MPSRGYIDENGEWCCAECHRYECTCGVHGVLAEVLEERRRQDAKWGGLDHDDEHDWWDWDRFIGEHLDRARHVNNDSDWDVRRKQLIRVAALAVAAVESMDRKGDG